MDGSRHLGGNPANQLDPDNTGNGSTSYYVNDFRPRSHGNAEGSRPSIWGPESLQGLVSPQQQGIDAHAGRNTKRARPEITRSAMSYPRKRAVRACQLCRTRKTKCNNVRPVCGACGQIGASCVYEDSLDHSSFDPASLVILDHLNQIIETLNTYVVPGTFPGLQQQTSDAVPPVAQGQEQDEMMWNGMSSNSTDYQSARGLRATGHHLATDQSLTSQDPTVVQEDHSSSEYLQIPPYQTTTARILQWPIFKAQYPVDCLNGNFLSFDESADQGDSEAVDGDLRKSYRVRSSTGGFGVQEEEIEGLIEYFLASVHIKNPILHADSLRSHARTVAEHGPQWDAKSCLVYLACSLGCLAQPFELKDFSPPNAAYSHEATSARQDNRNLRHAEAYYNLARKRIGLLLPSIVTAHCYFFSGVYLMYIMEPLQAWHNFYQASTLCHMCLQASKPPTDERTVRLEQCLYWSCFKSECEMRGELPLPPSALGTIEYPHLFPTPPDISSPAAERRAIHGEPLSESYSPAGLSSFSHRQNSSATYNEDQSWYYYLTEIALRRIGNRVLNAFYKDEFLSWRDMPIPTMIKIAKSFENEISQRADGLPNSLRYVQEDLRIRPTGELPYVVRARVIEIRSWICRPFLFYAIHRPAHDPHQTSIRPFVDRALEYCFRIVESVAHRHRHHGTWYALRSGTTASLLVIAAVKCGHISVPAEWEIIIAKHIRTLKYWESEAPDIAKARLILEAMATELGVDLE